MIIDTKKCPICNQDNHCGNESGETVCWCSLKSFPEEIFKLIPEEKLHKACICKSCFEKMSKSS